MQRWEYKTIYSPEALNHFGQEGWELVAIRYRYFLFIVTNEEWILKRPVDKDGWVVSNVEKQLNNLVEKFQDFTWENGRQRRKMLSKFSSSLFSASDTFESQAKRSNENFFDGDKSPEAKIMFSSQFHLFWTMSKVLRMAGRELIKKEDE